MVKIYIFELRFKQFSVLHPRIANLDITLILPLYGLGDAGSSHGNKISACGPVRSHTSTLHTLNSKGPLSMVNGEADQLVL